MSDRRTGPGEAPGVSLPDYAAMASVARTDAERWPTLSPTGHARLARWRAHPHAPAWVHACGDLLTDKDHDRLRRHRAELRRAVPGGGAGSSRPAWVDALVERSTRHTGFYRRLGARPFEQLPLVSRSDLSRGIADFVPQDVSLERVVQGTSSGSTGTALVVPLDPVGIAAELELLDQLLADVGVAWTPDPDRFGLLSVVDQHQAFTYASILTRRREQPMARVNLAPSAWARVGDREAFLAAARPQVVTGTALSLLRLAGLPDPAGQVAPLALVSGAVHLTPAARSVLDSRFGVPVLDLYGLKETGPLAVSSDGGAHRLVPGRVHLEAVDATGRAVPDGARGELVVTTAENPFLPLLRYRTGDWGVLGWSAGRRTITALQGRAPVVFEAADGRSVPSVDLTQQLQHHGAVAWAVHQSASGDVTARVALAPGAGPGGLVRALTALLGAAVSVDTVDGPGDLGDGKVRSFASDRHHPSDTHPSDTMGGP